jgi:pimeloyl-ACP methyl ester carboxylesterase
VPTVRTETTRIEYLQDGPADGTPVVLQHGFPDDPHTWDTVVDLLPPGVLAIRPYLRGHGDSRVTAPDDVAGGAQVAALARDLLDLADHLELERFLLVGHDWGARTAHATAVLAPQRLTGLVTLSTAYGEMSHLTAEQRIAEARAAWYRWWLCTDVGAEGFRADVPAFVRQAWNDWSPGLRLTEQQQRDLVAAFDNDQFADFVVHYYRHGSGAEVGRARYAEDQATLDEWPAIEVPATFLYGLDDGCEVPEASRGNDRFYAAGYERVELPGVGHFIAREAPMAVADAITAHLA